MRAAIDVMQGSADPLATRALSTGESTATEPGHTDDFAALLRRLVDIWGDGRFTVRSDETWAHADGPDRLPTQGWKLHVSATLASAAEMIEACAPLLLDAGCSFKVARTQLEVQTLTSPHCPRGNAGKVLTAYPATDAEAVALAHQLDAATRNISGPRILNDRQLTEGSIVHYRYGVFTGTPLLRHDGELCLALTAPDGRLAPDVRGATFSPPPWVVDPFAATAVRPERGTASTPRRVLIGDRFAVTEAIRHANKGGIYRGVDLHHSSSVVIKQGRAHVAADRAGNDARDHLRHEWSMLHRVSPTGLVPKAIDLVEQGGDVFLVEADLAAPTLRAWVIGEPGTAQRRSTHDSLTVLQRIVDAVDRVHGAGVVLRDLTPNNVLVHDDLTVSLVDLELAIPADAEADLCRRSGTAAYASSEQLAGAAPHISMDLHAVGAIILFTLTGEDPLVGADGSTTLEDWLDRGTRRRCLTGELTRLTLRLCGDADTRSSLADTGAVVRAALDRAGEWSLPSEAEVAAAATNSIRPLADSVADEAIEALLSRLVNEIDVTGRRLTGRSTFGETTLPTNVQHGAAGLIGVLAQAGTLLRDTRAIDAAGRVAAWIERTPVPTGGSVGLHFGHAGPAWALGEAGALLGDVGLLERAVERALSIPTTFPGPDVTQGVSGLGLTLVRLAELSGDRRLHATVAAIAQRLASTATRDHTGISWRTPADAPSSFAGKRFHGFAHGTAGIGTFLWYAAHLLDDDRLHLLAVECATTLVQAASRRLDGRLLWGSGPEEPEPGIPHWCNGSSGVATFLARLGGDVDLEARLDGAGATPLDEVLDGAARAIVGAKWASGIAYCHGLSGNADALLDMTTGTHGSYHAEAGELLRIMWDRRQTDERGLGLSDEPGRVTADFAVGYSGALSTLLRYRHGGPRIWLPGGAS